MAKRPVDLVVLSDVHLGTYGCHAKELLKYLKSIRPSKVILNGDIIDIWQFSKNYWPESHMKVIRRIMKFITDGIPVYYLTGNHDEMLRKFADLHIGSFHLLNKMVLPLGVKGEEKAWIFHGDVFDITMQHSKWLAKLGAIGYDSLILMNSLVNYFLTLMNKEKMSFSKKVKGSIKNAVKFMSDFEQTAAELAAEKNYQYVICGHIHHPVIQEMKTKKGRVIYLNSGDWIENLSSLEYHNGRWDIFKYNNKDFIHPEEEDPNSEENEDLESKVNVNLLYENLVSSSRNR